jgi:hypothetical protein
MLTWSEFFFTLIVLALFVAFLAYQYAGKGLGA